jgi:hypothetical protein
MGQSTGAWKHGVLVAPVSVPRASAFASSAKVPSAGDTPGEGGAIAAPSGMFVGGRRFVVDDDFSQ